MIMKSKPLNLDIYLRTIVFNNKEVEKYIYEAVRDAWLSKYFSEIAAKQMGDLRTQMTPDKSQATIESTFTMKLNSSLSTVEHSLYKEYLHNDLTTNLLPVSSVLDGEYIEEMATTFEFVENTIVLKTRRTVKRR